MGAEQSTEEQTREEEKSEQEAAGDTAATNDPSSSLAGGSPPASPPQTMYSVMDEVPPGPPDEPPGELSLPAEPMSAAPAHIPVPSGTSGLRLVNFDEPGPLGLRLSISGHGRKREIVIEHVKEGSPAERAGLIGDSKSKITGINGRALPVDEMVNMLRQDPPDSSLGRPLGLNVYVPPPKRPSTSFFSVREASGKARVAMALFFSI
uniref:PDZ domain-containing protein n=1 Tax=Haptolina brevifila TaxID=156173 RepID=A0A7S2JS37_9EUKA|mmetsp:Transcript_9043/g.18380  ORF Transcript_9043/g.18380 Transcript_9043/m.18380 type:complete len:207 (+) Transcript_9043:47-667(+)